MHPDAIKLLVEMAKREEKYYKLYTSFRPNPKVTPITPKFYARHEALDQSFVKEEYVQLLKREVMTPKEKYPYPLTVNQCYGWYTDPLIDNKMDFRLDFRRKITPEIKLACEMQQMTKKMRSVTKTEAKK